MFTGIIEHFGKIESLTLQGDGGRVTIDAPTVAASLAVSNSIAVNGCCLTIVKLEGSRFSADLSGETIRRTSFGAKAGGLKVGARVNLEQPLTAGREFGGHFVLGHVDGISEVVALEREGNSENWNYSVRIPGDCIRYIVNKGSITIDGISLTVALAYSESTGSSKSPYFVVNIAVIPYTYEHTNIRDRKPGDKVNLEGDVLGKYIDRYLEARQSGYSETRLSLEELKAQGF